MPDTNEIKLPLQHSPAFAIGLDYGSVRIEIDTRNDEASAEDKAFIDSLLKLANEHGRVKLVEMTEQSKDAVCGHRLQDGHPCGMESHHLVHNTSSAGLGSRHEFDPMQRLLTNRPELGVCEHGTDRSTDWCVVCDRDLFPAVDALPASESKYVCKCGTHHAKEPMYCVHRFEQAPKQAKGRPDGSPVTVTFDSDEAHALRKLLYGKYDFEDMPDTILSKLSRAMFPEEYNADGSYKL